MNPFQSRGAGPRGVDLTAVSMRSLLAAAGLVCGGLWALVLLAVLT